MKKRDGFMLMTVLLVFLFLMIIVPVMVKWVQHDTKMSVKDQKSSLAFGLAEAAVDRGFWKVKSSTATFAQVSGGGTLNGYDFDATYRDITGGSYRISIVAGPGVDQVTILGEGRDTGDKETRAIKAVFTNTSVPGALLARGDMKSTSAQSVVHWGPIMARGDITVTTSSVANTHFPRKLAMGTVHPFDKNTNPPNTDSLEWWSNYNVPDLPIFDFTTMQASAAATGTLDCQDVYATHISTSYTPSPGTCGSGKNKKTCTCDSSGNFGNCSSCSGSCTPTYTTITDTVATMKCCHYDAYGAIACDYPGGNGGCMNCTVTDIFHQTTMRDKDYTWYWRHNVTWGGYTGIKGTVIVRGDFSLLGDKDDRYCRSNDTTSSLPASPGCVLNVPPQAWREYQKFDTGSSDQYPGDTGYHQNVSTYWLGSSTTESSASGGDLGIYGFLYVSGNLTAAGASDIYGAEWIEGDVTGGDNTMVFYNSKLKVPTLNVVLQRDSWEEQPPSAVPWQ